MNIEYFTGIQIMDDCKMKEDTYRCEVDSLKKQLASVTDELQDRNITMATLTEKMAALERQSREHDEILERKKSEIHVRKIDAVKLIYIFV